MTDARQNDLDNAFIFGKDGGDGEEVSLLGNAWLRDGGSSGLLVPSGMPMSLE